ncbi:hypothetical protein COOONC_14598 [Cooperia oncophora]
MPFVYRNSATSVETDDKKDKHVNTTTAATTTTTTAATTAMPVTTTGVVTTTASKLTTLVPLPDGSSSSGLIFLSMVLFIVAVAVIAKIIYSNRKRSRSDLIGGTARWRLAASQQSGTGPQQTAASYAPMDGNEASEWHEKKNRGGGGLDTPGPDRLDWERQFFDDTEATRLSVNVNGYEKKADLLIKFSMVVKLSSKYFIIKRSNANCVVIVFVLKELGYHTKESFLLADEQQWKIAARSRSNQTLMVGSLLAYSWISAAPELSAMNAVGGTAMYGLHQLFSESFLLADEQQWKIAARSRSNQTLMVG